MRAEVKPEGLRRVGGIRRRSCGNALLAKNIPDRAGAKAQRWKGGENGRETGKYFNTILVNVLRWVVEIKKCVATNPFSRDF